MKPIVFLDTNILIDFLANSKIVASKFVLEYKEDVSKVNCLTDDTSSYYFR